MSEEIIKNTKTYKSLKEFNESKSDYYIGLDIGVGSVGWAVTDTEYNLIRIKNNKSWGVYLFNEAKSAKERRLVRGQRRRLKRRKERLDLLRLLFENEVNKEDEEFFKRLDNSFFLKEDKQLKNSTKYSLFNDTNFTDKEYFKIGLSKDGLSTGIYNTPYHLREYLKYNDAHNVRELYLCLAHMIKYRGNFLYSTNSNGAIDESAIFDDFIENLKIYFNRHDDKNPRDNLDLTDDLERTIEEIKDLLKNNSLSKKDKSKKLAEILYKDSNQANKMSDVFKPIFGLNIDFKKIINLSNNNYKNDVENDESDFDEALFASLKEIKNFETEDFESNELNTINELVPDFYNLFKSLFNFYRYCLFNKVLSGEKELSKSLIKIYEKHNKDKKELKNFLFKINRKDLYDDIFKKYDESFNYTAYIKRHNKEGKRCSNKEFVGFLSKVFKEKISKDKLLNDEQLYTEYNNIIQKIDNKEETYFPLLVSSIMSYIPYQLNLEEMRKILKRQETKLG